MNGLCNSPGWRVHLVHKVARERGSETLCVKRGYKQRNQDKCRAFWFDTHMALYWMKTCFQELMVPRLRPISLDVQLYISVVVILLISVHT